MSAPRRVGPYEVLDEVARGGMGVVLRARHPRLDRDVALKVLLAGRGAAAAQRERFAREARALARIDHPHVVRVYDVGEDDGAPYLVLDYIEGESLEARLRREGPLAPQTAVALVAPLADAIAHAHERGVLHRDLKPSNVLVRREDGAPLLTDFGLARALEPEAAPLSRTGALLGTPGYWAPEQARGERQAVGPHTDVYGLGALLYALLTGVQPHEAATLVEALAASERLPRAPSAHRAGIAPALDALCLRALAVDARERFASAAAVAAALRALPPPAPALEEPTTAPRRGRVVPLLLAGAGLLCGAALVMVRCARPAPAAPAPRPSTPPAPRPSSPPAPRPAPSSPSPPPSPHPVEVVLHPEVVGAPTQGFVPEVPLAIAPLLAEARERFVARDVAGAIAACERALEVCPDSARLHHDLGNYRLITQELDRAQASFERAIALEPRYAAAYRGRANVWQLRGDLTRALADSDRLVELAGDQDAYNQRAVRRELVHDYRGAAQDWARLVELVPPGSKSRATFEAARARAEALAR